MPAGKTALITQTIVGNTNSEAFVPTVSVMRAANPSPAGDAEIAPVPAVSGGLVYRDGLLARLGAAARVTQISAPAGSGWRGR